MWEENNVIVVDDDEQRRHDFRVILDFLGEEPVSCSCGEWEALLAKPEARENTRNVKAVIFGQCDHHSLDDRLQQAHEWDRSCPAFVLGDHDIESVEEPDLRHKVIAHIEFPPSYNIFAAGFGVTANTLKKKKM